MNRLCVKFWFSISLKIGDSDQLAPHSGLAVVVWSSIAAPAFRWTEGACCPALLPLSLTRGWGKGYCWLLYWFSFLLFFYLLCLAGGAEHRGFAVSRHLSLTGSSHCPWLFLHWASWLAPGVRKDWKSCQMLIEFLLSNRVLGSGVEGSSWEIVRAMKMHYYNNIWSSQHFMYVLNIFRAIALTALCLWELFCWGLSMSDHRAAFL